MLHQPTIEKMDAMRLDPMVQAWKQQEESSEARALPFEDRLALLIDRLWTVRQTLAIQQRLRRAKLRLKASVEDIDFRAPPVLRREQGLVAAECDATTSLMRKGGRIRSAAAIAP